MAIRLVPAEDNALLRSARDRVPDDPGSLWRAFSAVLALGVWPLVVLDVHFGI